MNLKEVRVRNYKVIDDTGWVSVDNPTCLVGKNESGKTVFMQALSRLNPSYGSGEFVPFDEFPRHRWPEYKQRHEDNPAPVASARFDLEDEERAQIEEEYGALEDSEVTVTKGFANELHWDVRLEDDSKADEVGAAVLENELPEFRYVGEYAIMDGTIDVTALAERYEEGTLDSADRVFLSFLSVAGLDLAELERADDWRDLRTELEAASGALTASVAEYWSQTDDLDIRIEQENDNGMILSVRVENLDQDVTVEFEKRSRGFRWFFSTFCQLNELQESDEDVVLLLDEPGLNLHPKAKRDFLRYLEAEFAPSQTLFYTAHSPFMIDAERIHRTRMIQKTSEHGSTILSDAADADEYTRFPLKNAFELNLMDTLLSRSRVLLVQNSAVHTYLYGISELMEAAGTNGLNPRWTVLPVNTVENVPTFLGMFESYDLDAAVLLEGETARETERELSGEVSVRDVGEYADVSGGATVEDLLSTPFYLDLVNRAYADALANTDGVPDRLTGEYFEQETGVGPIVERLTAFFEQHGVTDDGFDREVPAAYFREHRGEFTDELDLDTKRNFGSLVQAFDEILDSVTRTSQQGRSFVDVLLGR
ncbi:MAG: hypothetical protein V5A55_07520 [Halovenus sp.]